MAMGDGQGRGNGSQGLALNITTPGKGGAAAGPRNPRVKELSATEVLGRAALRTVFHHSFVLQLLGQQSGL